VNGDGPADPIAQTIGHLDSEPITATFGTISLLEFHQYRSLYEWTQAKPLPIGRFSYEP
jgi:hypothetical protein